jgi:hypothetical protein
MASASKISYESSKAYLGVSKFTCHCGEGGDLWRSGTTGNMGRLFIKCGMVEVMFSSTLFLEIILTWVFCLSFYSNTLYFERKKRRSAIFGSGRTSFQDMFQTRRRGNHIVHHL